MKKNYEKYTLEDFISDNEFFDLAKAHFKGDDSETWKQLLLSYPDKEQIIEKAYLLINGIKITEIPVDREIIRHDWQLLERTIRRRRNRKIIYWASSVAACFMLVLSGLYLFNEPTPTTPNKQELISRLTETETTSNDIQIITSENKVTTLSDRDASIKEKEDGSLVINENDEIEESEYIQVNVPKGKRSFIELKDGSKIWINSGTKLLYPSHLNKKKREVYVEGEIYLEVAKNESLPFFVHTTNLDVQVLGTSFNVTAYKDDIFTEIVLVSGSVEINTVYNKTTRLTPNTSFYLADSISNIKQVDVYNYICWKEGIMKLEGEELQSVFKRLSRYYNIEITAPAEIGRIRYFGKLGLEDNLDNILYNISLVEPIGFEHTGNTIRIYPLNN